MALGYGAGLVMVVAALAIAGAGRVALGVLVGAAAAAWMLFALELSDRALPYTLALIGPTVAIGLCATAVIVGGARRVDLGPTAGPDGEAKRRRFHRSPGFNPLSRKRSRGLALGLVTVAVVVALAPLLAIDTAAIGEPDNLMSLDGSLSNQTRRSLAHTLVTLSGWVTAVTSLTLAALLVSGQLRARGASLAAAIAGVVATALIAIPAGSSIGSHDGFDLSPSPMIPVALMVATTGVATAVAWERAQTATRHRETQAAQARIAEASEASRRKVERDLHDGAQQRLIAIQLALRSGQRRLAGRDSEVDDLLDDLSEGLAAAVTELRDLSRGVYPAILDQGLGPALESMAETSPLPMTVAVAATRCAPSVEQGVYFVVAEALSNATRHAQASHLAVAITNGDRNLVCAISDDGRGGAGLGRTGSGAGLENMRDRVLALDGTWSLTSLAGQGTTIEIEVPCG